jgi:hypothetical protein
MVAFSQYGLEKFFIHPFVINAAGINTVRKCTE